MPKARFTPLRKSTVNRLRRVVGRSRRTFNQRVKSAVLRNIETKHQIYNFGATGITTSPTYISIYRSMFQAQGSGESTFIGNRVNLQSLRVKGVITQADNSNLLRVVCFRPTSKYEPADGDTDIFNNAAQPLLSSLDKHFVKKVMMDRLYTLNSDTSSHDQQRVIGRTFNLHNQKLDLTAVGDPNYQLCWCFVSDSAVASNPTVEMTHELRIKDA